MREMPSPRTLFQPEEMCIRDRLYTAPAMVVLMSALVFKEKITGKKLVALALAPLGCALVTGVFTGGLSLKMCIRDRYMASPWIFCESLRLATAPYYREARVTSERRQTCLLYTSTGTTKRPPRCVISASCKTFR